MVVPSFVYIHANRLVPAVFPHGPNPLLDLNNGVNNKRGLLRFKCLEN
jgi:hypothetical protein